MTTHRWHLPLLALILSLVAACSAPREPEGPPTAPPAAKEPEMNTDVPVPPETAKTETATFGAGCFWCVEAVFEQLDGVSDVRSGYMGGDDSRASYKEVCSGSTGHAEVVQVDFDPALVTYEKLLDWFWRLHDPTTLNRQGADVGTQYRSAIFVHSAAQRAAAEKSKAAADSSSAFDRPIVTEITPAAAFHEAEDYHQDYYRLNGRQPYCQAVIRPKLGKLGLTE